jgi:hypothetical protein
MALITTARKMLRSTWHDCLFSQNAERPMCLAIGITQKIPVTQSGSQGPT